MRKVLIGVLIVVLVVAIGLTLGNGISLGKLQIASLQQLSEKNQKLEENITTVNQMKQVKFTESMDELNKQVKELKSKREEYAALVNDTAEGTLEATITAEKYEVEYLWVKLGNYATKNGVTLKLNILNASTGLTGMYDLQFTLNGKYAGITEFIYEIENDATLGFRIDNFLLTPTTVTNKKENNNNNNQTNNETTVDTDVLTATFTVREVAIDIEQQSISNIGNNNAQEENNQTDNANQ